MYMYMYMYMSDAIPTQNSVTETLRISSLIVMDYDEFSADDFIGGTRVKLYEVLYAQSHKINIRRLLDDNIVSLRSALNSVIFPRIIIKTGGFLINIPEYYIEKQCLM